MRTLMPGPGQPKHRKTQAQIPTIKKQTKQQINTNISKIEGRVPRVRIDGNQNIKDITLPTTGKSNN